VPHLSPTTLTTDEKRLILRVTAGNVRDHTIISLALGSYHPRSITVISTRAVPPATIPSFLAAS
jgi:hypothetical protein